MTTSWALVLALAVCAASPAGGREPGEIKAGDLPDPVAEDETGLEDELAFLQEEDIVFTASKHEQDIAESPSAITVITREQIENTHCTDVACLLRQVPEVNVRMVLPGYASIGARALSDDFESGALVLVDGREIGLEIFGCVIWQALPLHLQDIERVEVIRGPGSALYGPNAQKLVVSIFTREATESGAAAFLGGGEHNRSSLNLRLDQRLGGWSLTVAGGLELGDNWQIRGQREREVGRVWLGLSRDSGGARTLFQLGTVLPSGMLYSTLAPVWVKYCSLTHLLAAHRTEAWHAQIFLNLLDSGVSIDMPLVYRNMKLGALPDVVDLFSSDLDAQLQYNWSPFSGNLLIVGGNYRWLMFLSDDIDPELIHQHRVGVFLHDEQRLFSDLLLTAGLRFDYNNITRPALSPRLAATWRFSKSQLIRIGFGQAYRKPAFYETSCHIKGVRGESGFAELEDFILENIGNDHLQNEKVTTFEAGYRLALLEGRLDLEAGVFYSLYRDIISFRTDIQEDSVTHFPDLQASSMRFENRGREVDSLGGSASLTYRARNAWWLSVNYTFRHSWYISDPPGGASATEGGRGDRVPWEPAHLFNLAFHRITKSGWRFGAALHAFSSSDFAWPEDGIVFSRAVPVHNPFGFFLSGFAAWRVEVGSYRFELGVKAFNVLNRGFRDLPAVTRPDGVLLGGELMGRLIFLYASGTI